MCKFDLCSFCTVHHPDRMPMTANDGRSDADINPRSSSSSSCRDPDSVVLCVLATDEEDEDDIALQIHFTLLQAFCCDNDINILRVSGMTRLSQLLEEDTEDSNGNEPRDLHCILVTNPPVQPLQSPALQNISSFCEESRCRNQWVPCVEMQVR
uniref:Ribosomal protein eL8/eL30/eS12/Gadd45 domain-containing protein n=1 Tax=Gasterosteus aculeatus aculeatus TaxID=481459 RepID=A0AAQ4Q8D2_GASAC